MDYTAPCGVCRQVMMEFCQPETFQIILAVDEENYKVCSLRELFPFGFGPDNLQERDEKKCRDLYESTGLCIFFTPEKFAKHLFVVHEKRGY